MMGNEKDIHSNLLISTENELTKVKPRDIAASMQKMLCQKVNPVKSYSKTKMTVFVLNLWEKYRWGLSSFGQ